MTMMSTSILYTCIGFNGSIGILYRRYSTKTVQCFHQHGMRSVVALEDSDLLPWNSSFGMRKRHHSTDSKNLLTQLDKNKIREELLQAWMVAEASSDSPSSKSRRARYCRYTYEDAKCDYASRQSTWHWLDQEMSSNLAGETGAVSIYKGALSALSIRQWFLSSFTDRTNKPAAAAAAAVVDIEQGATEFCNEHYQTEESHRRCFNDVLPIDGKRTRLLPVWRLAGYFLGFLPTLVGGPTALYVTVEAVETFVEEHFQDQIVPLRSAAGVTTNSSASTHVPPLPECPELLKLLEACCEDEVHHKEDAALKLLGHFTTQFSSENQSTESVPVVVGLEALPSHHLWWARPWSFIVRNGSAVAAEVARRI
mmetsp:Transcript_25418/g.60076  ORF Transcript_25418/g.60076 Transcript_25418/m.60076 type:complete len:367 (-) Transcript_25418:1570-2670(-)